MCTLPVTDVFATGWFSHSCIVGLCTIKPSRALWRLLTAFRYEVKGFSNESWFTSQWRVEIFLSQTRVVGIEPTNVGVKVRCVNRFTTPLYNQKLLFLIYVLMLSSSAPSYLLYSRNFGTCEVVLYVLYL